ncbi:MAG: M48 family metallopeptidase [Patescibacteria group bacterium]
MVRHITTAEKQINLAGKNISYILKINPNAKHLRLAVYVNGELVVTQPRFVSAKVVENFILSQAEWILKKINKSNGSELGLLNRLTRRDYLRDRAAARELISARLKYYNSIYHYDYARLTIRNQKTRWGSCSKQGNLSFNFRLFYLPARLRDYVIVHELCHLKEFNHSAEFWRLVAKTVPNFKNLRKELRSNLNGAEADDTLN